MKVAYLLLADNISGPLSIRLKGRCQPVTITQTRFQPPIRASCTAFEQALAAQLHDHPPALCLRAPAAAATAEPETSTPL
jgi:hypothetical protein